MLQLDKSIYPVVLYAYYLICIFMKIHETLKKREKSRNKYKPRIGVELRSILHSYGLLNSFQIV